MKKSLVAWEAPAYQVDGLTGATSSSRYVGGTASGAPTSGTFLAGDFIVARNGHIWVCTVGGTPGTWVDTVAAGVTLATTVQTESGLDAGQVGTSTNVAREDHRHPITNLVDLATTQTVGGAKTFSALGTFNAGITVPSGQALTTGTRSVVTGTRAITTNVADTVDLGTFSTPAGAMELRIHTHLAAPISTGANGSITKVYEVAVGQTTGFGATVTNITNVGTTVTVTVASTAGLVGGMVVAISGAAGITNVNGTWLIGNVTATTFDVTVTTTPTGTYTASSAWSAAWYVCLPADASQNAAASGDYALEVLRTAPGTFYFRFRQKSLAAGAVTFTVETLGDAAVTFTPSTTVTSNPRTVTAQHPSNSFVAAAGNVGIGTESPAYLLDVNGTVNAYTVRVGGTVGWTALSIVTAYGRPGSFVSAGVLDATSLASTATNLQSVPGTVQFQGTFWTGLVSAQWSTYIASYVTGSSGNTEMYLSAFNVATSGQFNSGNVLKEMGNRVYSPGNKPTAADIGAGTFPGANSYAGLQTFSAGITVPAGQSLTTGTRSVVTGTRTTTTNVSDTVDLGTFSTAGGAMELRIHTHLVAGSSSSVTKVYEVAVSNSTPFFQNPTAVTFVGTLVTATVPSTAGLVAGQSIGVSGVGGLTNVNGTWTVTQVLSATQFTFTVTTTPTGAYTSGGSIFGWYLCLPADASGNAAATNDFALEVARSGSSPVFTFRFRQKSIGTAGVITFTAETMGDTAVTFTPSTTVTAAPPAVATPHPSNSFVAAAGNIGIGTEAPTSLLTIKSTGSGDSTQWLNSAGTLGSRIGVAGSNAYFGTSVSIGDLVNAPYPLYVKNIGTVGTAVAVFQGVSGQTGDLTTWANSSNTPLALINSGGTFDNRGGGGALITAGGLYNNSVEVLLTGYGNGAGTTQRSRFTDDGTWYYIQTDHPVLFTKPYSATTRVIINPDPAIATVPLQVKGVSGQTGDLQQWWSAAGVVSWINNSGTVIAPNGVWAGGASTGSGAILEVVPPSGNPGLAIKANGNDIARFLNSGGTQVALIDSVGAINGAAAHFGVYSGAPSAYMTVVNPADFPALILRGVSGQTTTLQEWQITGGTRVAQINAAGQFAYIGNDPASTGIVVRGASTQTAVLQEWQNNTASPLAAVAPDGRISSNGGLWSVNTYSVLGGSTWDSFGASVGIIANSSVQLALVVKLKASQTGSMTEWQNTSGVAAFTVDSGGNLQHGLFTNSNKGGAHVNIGNVAGDTGSVSLLIRAAASQTADQTQWLSSTPAVVAKITAGGNVAGTGAYTTLSDARSKTGIIDLPTKDALSVIRNLRPRHFSYTESPDEVHVGFVAQELLKVLPEAVVPFDDDRLGTRDGTILAYLVAAVQQLADRK